MPLVAVSPRVNIRGLCEPGYRNPRYKSDPDFPTYDWRHKPGSASNTSHIIPSDTVVDLTNALAADYDTPALFVCYVLRDANGQAARYQPRVNKSGLPWLLSQDLQLTVEVFAADIDNPEKRGWDGPKDPLLHDMRRTLASIPNIGFYFTPSGARIIQPLTRPLPAGEGDGESEPSAYVWLKSLVQYGLVPDFKCKDWTRHYYLPNAVRNGKRYKTLYMNLERMQPISAPAASGSSRKNGKQHNIVGLSYSRHVPEAFEPIVSALAEPILAGSYKGYRHGIYLALSGALLHSNIPPEHVPAIVRAVAHAGGARDPEHHRRSALDTIAEWAAGRAVRGRRGLPPEVCATLDRVTRSGQHPSSGAPYGIVDHRRAMPLAQANELLGRTIRDAPMGLTVVETPTGLGKTAAACGIARDRAATSKRTSIAVPTHEKAKELFDLFESHDIPVKRIFGQLSLKYDTGDPVCRHYDNAKLLQQGGHSVGWEFCEGRGKSPCTFRDSCKAYPGWEGDSDARIMVGPHALLHTLSDRSGLLVIDETPQLSKTDTVTENDLTLAEELIALYEPDYADSMLKLIASARQWLESATLDSVSHGIAIGSKELRAALADKRTPPLRQDIAIDSRRDLEMARGIGASSRVLRCLWDALVSEPCTISAQLKNSIRQMSVTHVPTQVGSALLRDDSTVMLDASASVNRALYDRIVPGTATVTIDVADRSKVERVVLFDRNAVRARGLGAFDEICRYVASAVEWLLEDKATLDVLIVSIKQVEELLAKAMLVDHEIGDSLRLLPRPPELAHFGELRGLNVFEEFDAIVTIGDPWQNVTHVNNTASLCETDPYKYGEMLARAELQQVHGRIRTIHRERRARLCHIGALLPLGWEKERVDVRGWSSR